MYYGQIGDLLGLPAVTVGNILTGLNDPGDVPWYRVVAKDGYISSLKLGSKGERQRGLLRSEGYRLVRNRVDMDRHLWLFAGVSGGCERAEEYAQFLEGLKR
jgi:alkylated DNA nucleotide flippase Atl1